MIKINGIKIKVEHFPDGSQRIMDFPDELVVSNPEWSTPYFEIVWLYEDDGEMFTLHCVVEHLRRVQNYSSNMVINLVMPYVPNGRLDRIYSDNEVFTLKYFANFINGLNFNKVSVFDPHSNVTTALIDRIHHLKDVSSLVEQAMDIIGDDDNLTIYFPDEGAYKRYSNLSGIEDFPKLYGKKVRDWKTGKISHIDIYNEFNEKATENEICRRKVLMIDDIISYGGTMAYSADKLKEMGAVEIYAYASHTENSILDKEKGTFLNRLNDNIINGLFTTNSIYNGSHPRIRVIHEF